MNKIRDVLASKGFLRKSSSVFVRCTDGGLIHFVALRKIPRGGFEVWVRVLCGNTVDANNIGNSVSDVYGKIGWAGVVENFEWPEVNPAAISRIELVLDGFFSQFRGPQDVAAVLEDRCECSPFSNESNLPSVSVPGGALRHARAIAACEALGKSSESRGFRRAQCQDVVFIRPAGELVDCLWIQLDKYATFASALCYPWSPLVWKADARWKGVYYPFYSEIVKIEGNAWINDTPNLEGVDPHQFMKRVDSAFEVYSEIKSPRCYWGNIGPAWSSVKSAMARFL